MQHCLKTQLFTERELPLFGLHLVKGYPNTNPIGVKKAALQSALKQAGCEQIALPIKCVKGKPPTTSAGWVLSLSHSGAWLFAGATSANNENKLIHLGIDIEYKRSRNFNRISNFLDWTTPSVSGAHFYRRWTLMESLYKAISPLERKLYFNTWFNLLDEKLLENIHTKDAVSIIHNDWSWRAEWRHFPEKLITCVVYGLEPVA